MGTRRGPPLVRGPQFENRWTKLTHVGFRAHVKIASRIVSYRIQSCRVCADKGHEYQKMRSSYCRRIMAVFYRLQWLPLGGCWSLSCGRSHQSRLRKVSSSHASKCYRAHISAFGGLLQTIYTVSQKSEPPKHFATAAANLHRFK